MSAPRLGVVVTIVEIGLVIGLGLAIGRVGTAMLSPLAVAERLPPPAPETTKTFDVGDPFRTAEAPEQTAAVAASSVTQETTLDLALHGTWVEEDGGSAVIRLPGGEQKIFFVGDAICCGARLERVYPDRVIISRGGVREALRLANKQTNERPRPPARNDAPPPQSAPPPGRIPPISDSANEKMQIGEIVRLQPVRSSDGRFRLQLYPAGDKTQFERLGLRAGDVLVSINGQPAPSNLGELDKITDALGGANSVMISVERGGAPISFTLSLDSQKTTVAQ